MKRQEILATLEEEQFYHADSIGAFFILYDKGCTNELHDRILAAVPWHRKLMGDYPVVFWDVSGRDLDRIKRMFPEYYLVERFPPVPHEPFPAGAL